MKILAWNIRQGGGSRTIDIAQSIIRHQADSAILSEYRNNSSGHYIRTKLLTSGFVYQYCSHKSGTKNGVLIASKSPCDFAAFSNDIPDFPEAIVVAKTPDIWIWGLYLPHKKKHSLFEFITDRIDSSFHHILIGDLNTGKNYLDQRGDSFWYTDKLMMLEQMGFRDAFRHVNGEIKEYSWFSHHGNGFRYDQCYVSEGLLPNTDKCEYSHHERENQISDHSAMILVFNS